MSGKVKLDEEQFIKLTRVINKLSDSLERLDRTLEKLGVVFLNELSSIRTELKGALSSVEGVHFHYKIGKVEEQPSKTKTSEPEKPCWIISSAPSLREDE